MNSSNESSLRGWQKWLLISVVTLVCSGIVVYFNFRVFDFYDAIPYVGVVLFLVLLSLITTLHIKRAVVVTRFLVAAFILEIALMGVLGVNATYSLYVMRKMSVATQAETSRNQSLTAASQFKGRKAQGRALKVVETATPVQSKQQVFDQYEGVLFWILAAEIGIGAVGMVILMALSFFGAFAVVTPAAPTPQIQTQTVVPTPAPQVHSPAPPPSAPTSPATATAPALVTTPAPTPAPASVPVATPTPASVAQNGSGKKWGLNLPKWRATAAKK